MSTAAGPRSRSRGAIGRADLLRWHCEALAPISSADDWYYAYTAPRPRATLDLGVDAGAITPEPSIRTEPATEPAKHVLDHLWFVSDVQQHTPEAPDPSTLPTRSEPIRWPNADALEARWAQAGQLGLQALLTSDWGGFSRIRAFARGTVDLDMLSERIAMARSLQPLPEQRRKQHLALPLILDQSLSMRPLCSVQDALSKQLLKLGIVDTVHRLAGREYPAPTARRDQRYLLFSDLQDPALMSWLRLALGRGAQVLLLCPSSRCAAPAGVVRMPLSRLSSAELAPAVAQMRACLGDVFHAYPEALSAWAGAWFQSSAAHALAWELWNAPGVARNLHFCARDPSVQVTDPELPQQRREQLMDLHRQLHMNAADASACVQILLRAEQREPERMADAGAQARQILHDLAQACARGSPSEQRDAALLLLPGIALLPHAERVAYAPHYSAMHASAERVLGLDLEQGRPQPAGLLPTPTQQATEVWRLCQHGDQLLLRREADLTEFQRGTLAFPQRLLLAPQQMLVVHADAGPGRAFAAEDGVVLATFGAHQAIELRSAQQSLTLGRFERPSWALGLGRDQLGAFVLAPGPGAQACRLDLTEAQRVLGADRYGVYTEITIQGVSQRLRWMEPGSFRMGSPEGEERYDDERPQHEVRLTQGFWLADTACTQAFWLALLGGDNPSHNKNDLRNPVEQVSWDDIHQRFLPALQQLIGSHVRVQLPSEAEWEYACRAGTLTAFSYGETMSAQQRNYNSDYWEYAVPAGSLPANPWGLFEMHGSVWEWCRDGKRPYNAQAQMDPEGPSSVFRVLRGGSWFRPARIARSAFRLTSHPGYRDRYFGFRFSLRTVPRLGFAGPEGPS